MVHILGVSQNGINLWLLGKCRIYQTEKGKDQNLVFYFFVQGEKIPIFLAIIHKNQNYRYMTQDRNE